MGAQPLSFGSLTRAEPQKIFDIDINFVQMRFWAYFYDYVNV